jgi:L-amino acid N-acyltransferase YncA
VDIRPIEASDWPAVFEIFRAVDADGNTFVLPEGLLTDEARSLWVEVPPGLTVVASRDGEILGTAKFGPNRPGRGAHVATASFMVRGDARGSGVGRRLCEYAIAWAKEHGFTGMQFNAVVSTNANAIALYRSLGFVTIGTVPRAFDSARDGRLGLDIMYLEFAQ